MHNLLLVKKNICIKKNIICYFKGKIKYINQIKDKYMYTKNKIYRKEHCLKCHSKGILKKFMILTALVLSQQP